MTNESKEYYEVTWTGIIEAGIPAKSVVLITNTRAIQLRKAGCTVRKVAEIFARRGWA